MKKAKDNNGITLITIIISIIIMAILVGVTTYSGIESYKEAKVVKFVSQMQLIQAKVDEIQKDQEEVNRLIENKVANVSAIEKAYQNGEVPFDDSITYNSDYINQFKLFTIDNLKNELDLENIDTDVLINFRTREVVAVNGVEHKENMYYTQYKLPNGQALFVKNGERIGFGFDIEKQIDGLNCLIKITNASPNAKLLYVEQEYDEEQEEWVNIGEWNTLSKYTRTGEEYSTNISKNGFYVFRLQDNDDINNIVDKRLEVVVTNQPKTNMESSRKYDYSQEIVKWAYAKNYVWIPRFVYNKSDSTEIKYVKGNSNIATDNTYIDSQNWIVPSAFSRNNQELTGIWIRKSKIDESMEEASLQIENLEKDIQKVQYIIENLAILGVAEVKGTEHLEEKPFPFEADGEEEFDGVDDYIRTDVALFSSDNIERNFIIELNVKSVDMENINIGNNKDEPTLLGEMDERNNSNNLKNGDKYYPGFNIKVEKGKGLKIETNSYALGKKVVYIPNTVQNVRILRLANKLYYSFDESNFVMINDYSDLRIIPFDAPVIFGAGLDGTGKTRRFFKGIIEDVSIRFIFDEATLDDYNSSEVDDDIEIDDGTNKLKTVYAYEGSIDFTNTDNNGTPEFFINTGLSMFKDQESLDKDFEISFVIENIESSNVSQAVIVNAKCERKGVNGVDWPGFTYRLTANRNAVELTAKGHTSGNGTSNTVASLIPSDPEDTTRHKITISRRDRVLYFQKDDAAEIRAYDFTNFTAYFDVPITIGASLNNQDVVNEPFRGFKGTLSHISVKVEE